jgi:AraC-like DNA-binding protein
MPHTATALTSWAKAIRKALEAAGFDARPLFIEAGLDMAALDDPNARYPVQGTIRLWQGVVQATGDPAFGLVVARHVTPTTFHALGYSLVASPTLKEAFERLVRYFHVVSDAAELEFHGTSKEYHFMLRVDGGGPEPSFESIDAFACVIVRMCRGLYRREYAPLRVSLRRPAPADTTPYERAFRAPVTFGAAQNLLVFDRATFELPLEGANAELARHNDEIIARYLARHARQNVASHVHAVLIEQLSLGEPSQQKIADTLHMSLRSLQRKLVIEGTSYTEILNDTRRELALSYIKDPHYSVSEITYLLGFSDTSSFTRAFRRWTGQAPTTYRETPRVADD